MKILHFPKGLAPHKEVETARIPYIPLIGDEVKWLSTAGMGVYWLHVRVDSRPKYYRYQGYKTL